MAMKGYIKMQKAILGIATEILMTVIIMLSALGLCWLLVAANP
jgi:hypothetical protein